MAGFMVRVRLITIQNEVFRNMKVLKVALCGIGITILSFFSFTACDRAYSQDRVIVHGTKVRTILVMPPVIIVPSQWEGGQSRPLDASHKILSQMAHPLAEGGYYVIPTALELETFHKKGLFTVEGVNNLSLQTLYGIFAADAALYTSFNVILNHSEVLDDKTGPITNHNNFIEATARLVDLETGATLWTRRNITKASDVTMSRNVFEAIIADPVTNIVHTVTFSPIDWAYRVSGVASGRLIAVGNQEEQLSYGPYSPYYKTDKAK